MKIKDKQEILNFCSQYESKLNVKVCDVEIKQGQNPTITIILNKEGGMDLDTCEKFHNLIVDAIDEFDPTFGMPYTLNVSSRGIDWAFKTENDFLSHIGQKVEVKLNSSIRGKKYYDGILISYNGNAVMLKVNDKTTFTIDLKNIVKINEYIDFE